MTTMKEKIIVLSRNKKLKKFLIIYTTITIIVMIMSSFIELEPIVSIMAIVFIVLWTMRLALNAIEEQEEQVIKSNKIIYIILSNEVVLFCYMMFWIACPIIEITTNLIGYKIITKIIIIIILFILTANISDLIAKHFKNKLSK